MLQPWLFVGFTGHRRLQDPDRIAGAIRSVLRRLEERTGMPLAVVSSVASGADTLFAEAAAERRLPWLLLLPFPLEEFQRDFEAAEWQRVERLLSRATLTRTEPPMDSRTDAYLECGIRTVESADVLIAVWDGQPAGGPGGTEEVVDCARRQQTPLIWIDALTGEIREERCEQLPRRGDDGTQPEQPAPALDPSEGGLPALQEACNHFDAEAQRHAPRARGLITQVIFLHLGATAVALCAPILGLWAWAAFLVIAAKIIALVYADRVQHRHHHVQGEWLRNRILAELCRSALGTWPLPASERVQQPLPVPGFRGWQRSLRLWHLLAPPRTRDIAAMSRSYADGRVRDQLEYFRRQLARAEGQLHRWRRWTTVATRVAILCGAVLLVLGVIHNWPAIQEWRAGRGYHEHDHETGLAERLVKLASLVLPLASAAILHWVVSQDFVRRVARNREMVGFLERSEARLARVTTRGALERLASEIETILLLEVLEWHSVSRFGGEAH